MNEVSAERLDKLHHLLMWEGQIKNARVRELFGLSFGRSSEVIRQFRDRHPGWTRWDHKAKGYFATGEAYQAWRGPHLHTFGNAASLTSYLALVQFPGEGGTPTAVPSAAHSADPSADPSVGPSSILATSPTLVEAYPDILLPSARIFAEIKRAIDLKGELEIQYRSLVQTAQHVRNLYPHALVRAGRRWHVRAYCIKDDVFTYFTFGRIVEAKYLPMTTAKKSASDDIAWNIIVPVELVPHPLLTPDQASVVRFDLLLNKHEPATLCRGALVNAFVSDAKAAVDIHRQLPPEYCLSVANVADVKPWLLST